MATSRSRAPATRELDDLYAELRSCRRCPRLVAWREEVGRKKRRAFRGEGYWARPVPGFGDPRARLLIFGLAPGAHGSNRTGRMFTGDASGRFLYPALWRAGLASQPHSEHRGDGLELHGVYITAAVRCVPPGNKPTRAEFAACGVWTERELALLPELRVYLALGRLAHDALLEHHGLVKARFPFAHGAEHTLPDGRVLLDSYHVSRQNTQTGRLTAAMFDEVLTRAKALAGLN
ncbi:uracil-DNA glycosylase [Oceanithermus desulfurans]